MRITASLTQYKIFDDILRLLMDTNVTEVDAEKMWLESCLLVVKQFGLSSNDPGFYEVVGEKFKRMLIKKVCEGRGISCELALEHGPVTPETK